MYLGQGNDSKAILVSEGLLVFFGALAAFAYLLDMSYDAGTHSKTVSFKKPKDYHYCSFLYLPPPMQICFSALARLTT